MDHVQIEWRLTKLNGSGWMAHRELNSGLSSRNLGSTNIPKRLIQSSADEVSSSWRTSCSYNLETHCSMCRDSYNRTCPMNYLRLQYIGWNKSVVTFLFLQEPIPTVCEYHINIVSPCNLRKSSSLIWL